MEKSECPVCRNIIPRITPGKPSHLPEEARRLIDPNGQLKGQGPGDRILKCPICFSYYLCRQELPEAAGRR